MEWLSTNPLGFVLNTEKTVGTKYMFFHRAACRHISEAKAAQPDAYTGNKYIKVCSDNLSNLIEWTSSNRTMADGHFCKDCNPDDALATIFPEEIPASVHFEGAARKIRVNAYERNPLARKLCLEVYGCSCVVCGFNFEKTFGQFAAGYIHVHHLVPLSKIEQSYEIAPVRDLRPVCPNCHAAIHMGGIVRSIEEIKELLND
jgi:5-methylcytosine-specific restriction protein A